MVIKWYIFYYIQQLKISFVKNKIFNSHKYLKLIFTSTKIISYKCDFEYKILFRCAMLLNR